MSESAPPAHVVLTTTSNPDEAARISRTLVEERLSAIHFVAALIWLI